MDEPKPKSSVDTQPEPRSETPPELPTFAPADITDGRESLQWESAYPKIARRSIWIECAYLAVLLALAPTAIATIWSGLPNQWLHLDPTAYRKLSLYSAAWFGGLLGGVLFAMKWHYHVVAKKLWHLDRRLWRFFTPHISSGLAFVVVCLISSGVIKIFDQTAFQSHSAVVGFSFLVGYFSDNAIAKLTEIAGTVFGVSRGKEVHPKESPVKKGGKKRRDTDAGGQ